jgi:hypothetical protein
MAEEQLKLEAQEALDELWKESAIPFKLTAHKVHPVEDVIGYYEVFFFDSRKRSAVVWWEEDRESFKSAVRRVMKRSKLEGGEGGN